MLAKCQVLRDAAMFESVCWILSLLVMPIPLLLKFLVYIYLNDVIGTTKVLATNFKNGDKSHQMLRRHYKNKVPISTASCPQYSVVRSVYILYLFWGLDCKAKWSGLHIAIVQFLKDCILVPGNCVPK